MNILLNSLLQKATESLCKKLIHKNLFFCGIWQMLIRTFYFYFLTSLDQETVSKDHIEDRVWRKLTCLYVKCARTIRKLLYLSTRTGVCFQWIMLFSANVCVYIKRTRTRARERKWQWQNWEHRSNSRHSVLTSLKETVKCTHGHTHTMFPSVPTFTGFSSLVMSQAHSF